MKPLLLAMRLIVALLQIRYDVMRLFGCLGDEERRKLTVGCSSDHRDVSLWDCDITIKYTIPFRDIKPALRLGDCDITRKLSIACLALCLLPSHTHALPA